MHMVVALHMHCTGVAAALNPTLLFTCSLGNYLGEREMGSLMYAWPWVVSASVSTTKVKWFCAENV